jgi:hypothetical protein
VAAPRDAATKSSRSLDVVIEGELIGMGTKAYGVCFVFSLIFDESFEQFLGKYVAFQQKLVVVFEAQQRFFER